MRIWTRFALALGLLLVPLVAAAQYKSLDQALSNLNRGFGSGDAQAVVAGIDADNQVVLQFPGLAKESGPFGRDQAQYLLDGLFNSVKPSGFEQTNGRGGSNEGQYLLQGRWTISVGGKPATRDLYITLQWKADHWSLASVKSSGK